MKRHFKSVEKYFGKKGRALAEKAASGAYYIILSESKDCEYDDDSGFYITTTLSWDGLASKTRKKLTIQDASAYSELTELEPQEEIEWELERNRGSGLDALELDYWDDIALKLAYQEDQSGLFSLCKRNPHKVHSVISVIFEMGDLDSLEDFLDTDIEGYTRQNLLETAREMLGYRKKSLDNYISRNENSLRRERMAEQIAAFEEFLASQA